MKPGLTPLIAGILLLIVAVLFPVGMGIYIFQAAQSAPQERFEIPGSTEFQADEAGRYYLWQHLQTEYEDAIYNVPTELPTDLEIVVFDSEGTELDFVWTDSMTTTSPSGSKQSVGYVELQAPTTLVVKVAGECPPTIFSVSQFKLFEILKSFFIGFALAALSAAIGLGLFVWGIIRLCMGDKPSENSTPPEVSKEA